MRFQRKETAYAGAAGTKPRGRRHAWDFNFLSGSADYAQQMTFARPASESAGIASGLCRTRFWHPLCDTGGDAVVAAALVGINLAYQKKEAAPLAFERFGDGVVDFRLAAVEALYGDGYQKAPAQRPGLGNSIMPPLIMRFSARRPPWAFSL